MSRQSEPAVGIDLGTTLSVVAHLEASGKPTTILNEEGERTTPSVVFFDPNGAIVGREALKAGEVEPARVARFAKRDMGELVFHKKILGQAFPPEAIQALVLKKVKQDAELQLGRFTKAVVTVPAYFNEPRRKATQDAGRLAGLDVIDIINEPTAAAIAYGVEQGYLNPQGEAPERELVLVYDLGGGTFDATLMDIHSANFRAAATAGDVFLGGIDWDQRVAEYFALQFVQLHGVDPRNDPAAKELLLRAACEAKHTLSARQQAATTFACAGQQVRLTITREVFQELTADLLDRTRLTVNKVLKEALVEWSDITRLLLVGGSTRMPMVREMLERESGKKVDRSLSPDEAVAHGAAIYAGVLLSSGQGPKVGVSVQNVNSHDLGVLGLHPETGRPQRHVMIPRNTQIPAERASQFQTSKENQHNVAVRVVEGGTDTGEGAAAIGKCVVNDLPPNLPAATPVMVTFRYESNGTLSVQAIVPHVQCAAATVIERAAGLSEEESLQWKAFIDGGAALAAADPGPLDDLEAIRDVNVQELIDFDQPQTSQEPDLRLNASQASMESAAGGNSPPPLKSPNARRNPRENPPPTPLESPSEQPPMSDSPADSDDALDDFLKGFG